MSNIFSGLKSYLNTSGIQKENNSLYQTILGLINGSSNTQTEVDRVTNIVTIITGGGGGTPPVTPPPVIPIAASVVENLDGTNNPGVSTEYSRGDHKHDDPNRPTDDEKDALVGTFGMPGAGNEYVTDDDPRLVADSSYYIPLTDGDLTQPELIFASGDVVLVLVP